jgi:hypothetical protein
MILRIFSSFVLLSLLLAGAPVLAADDNPTLTPPSSGKGKGTSKENSACSTDAAKFCSDEIPDTFRVLICLKQHRAKLKKACRQVLEDHGE